jgi:hypothetical protein
MIIIEVSNDNILGGGVEQNYDFLDQYCGRRPAIDECFVDPV